MKKNKIDNRYECFQDDLLLHSMANYMFQIKRILELLKPRSIVEVGIEGGKFSNFLLEYAQENNIHYIGIEPYPSDKIIELINSYGQELIQSTSLSESAKEALRSDIVFLDGDHNYFTVFNELKLIFNDSCKTSMVFMHDVSWPWRRRDLYYDITQLDQDNINDFTFEGGLQPGIKTVQPFGFSGEGNYAYAVYEGGEKNGVLTAVEDFLKESPIYTYSELLSIFGLGIIYNKDNIDKPLADFLEFFEASLDLWNPLFVNLEENRINLLLELWEKYRVIEQQTQLIEEQNTKINQFLYTRIKKLIKKLLFK